MMVVDIRMKSWSQLGSAHGVRSLAALSSVDASRGLPRVPSGGAYEVDHIVGGWRGSCSWNTHIFVLIYLFSLRGFSDLS